MIYYISEQMEFDNIIKEALNDINTVRLGINDEYINESVSIKSIAIKIKDFFMKIFNKFIDFLKKLYNSAKVVMIRKRIKNVVNKYSKKFKLNISIKESGNDDYYQQLSLFDNEVHIKYRMVHKPLLDKYMTEMQHRYDGAFKDKDNDIPDNINIEDKLKIVDESFRGLVEKVKQLITIDKCLSTQLEEYPNMLFDRKDDIQRLIVDDIINGTKQDYLEDYTDSMSKASIILRNDMNYLIEIFNRSANELMTAATDLMNSIESADITEKMRQYKDRVDDKISIEDRKKELARKNK